MKRHEHKPARRSPSRKGTVPLERALSKLGLASRAEARRWILAGRVSVDGRLCRRPERAVVPESIAVAIDGKAAPSPPPLTLLLYKPRGLITTQRDERGRRTVFSLVPRRLGTLHAVGRLDQATSGLLLLTNDSRLSSWLADPANKLRRVYLVTVAGRVEEDTRRRLEKGIVDRGERLRCAGVRLRKASGRETHLVVELEEGRNREIRRLLAALGHEVLRLKRVAFGGLTLGALQPGGYRALSAAELRRAFPGAPVRAAGSLTARRKPGRAARPP